MMAITTQEKAYRYTKLKEDVWLIQGINYVISRAGPWFSMYCQ